jgi:hypothetical protein
MIGETITGSKGSPHAWLACMVIGALMVAGNFAMKENHFLIMSLGPFAVGFAVLMTRREPLIFRFDDEGIEVLSPGFEFIPYRSIEALTVGDEEGRQASIAVLHRSGALNIPTDIDEESRRIYRFLRSVMPEEESIGPPPSLRPFMREQDEQFGERRVCAYRALGHPRFIKGLTAPFVCAALFVVAIIWMSIGAIERQYSEWLGIGALACTGCIVAFIVILANRRSNAKVGGDGGIIIAPVGIAVEQGDLLGRMRWDEITQIERNRMNYSLEIHFLGGKLTLGDVYHRSLRTIYRRIMDYWEGPVHDYY